MGLRWALWGSIQIQLEMSNYLINPSPEVMTLNSRIVNTRDWTWRVK